MHCSCSVRINELSVVNMSLVFTVDKSQLDECIGTLSSNRVRLILVCLQLAVDPRETE